MKCQCGHPKGHHGERQCYGVILVRGKSRVCSCESYQERREPS